MRRVALVVVLAATTLGPASVAAHEGHEHQVLGVIKSVAPGKLEVLAKEKGAEKEKLLSVVLTAQTKILRGTRPVDVADLEVGERVVLKVIENKGTVTAREVRVAPRAT